jgi:hypothetical protein
MEENTLLDAATVVLTEQSDKLVANTFYIMKDGSLYFIDSVNGDKIIAYRAKGWERGSADADIFKKAISSKIGVGEIKKF